MQNMQQRVTAQHTTGEKNKTVSVSHTTAVREILQPKLKIGPSDDKYEQEADRVAEQVMRMPEPTKKNTSLGKTNPHQVKYDLLSGNSETSIQRQETDFDEDENIIQAKATSGHTQQVTPDTTANIKHFKSGGLPIPPNQRNFFESRMGQDFSGVRIHTGSKAADTANSIQAKAFTLGNNIVFNTGQYSNGNQEGKKLLAHELTHVIQQGGGAIVGIKKEKTSFTPSQRILGESDQVCRQMLSTVLTPEEEFLRDMQSGVQSANEYVSYIGEAISYWQQHGIRVTDLDAALENLAKITGTISRGLSRFGAVLGGAHRLIEVVRWVSALNEFREAGRAFDPHDRESVRRWGLSMEQLRLQTEPFVEAVRGWLGSVALRGSAAAARASLFLSVLSAYAEVGVALLNRGIANVNRYHERREEYLAAVERAPIQRPQEPRYPGNWSTTAERRVIAQNDAEARRRFETRQREERERRALLLSFDTDEFPQIYRSRRRWLMRRIMRAMRRPSHPGIIRVDRLVIRVESIAERWYASFTSSGRASYFDEEAGIEIHPKALRTTREQRGNEIDAFAHIHPPCPYFERLYQQSLATYLRRQGTTRQP